MRGPLLTLPGIKLGSLGLKDRSRRPTAPAPVHRAVSPATAVTVPSSTRAKPRLARFSCPFGSLRRRGRSYRKCPQRGRQGWKDLSRSQPGSHLLGVDTEGAGHCLFTLESRLVASMTKMSIRGRRAHRGEISPLVHPLGPRAKADVKQVRVGRPRVRSLPGGRLQSPALASPRVIAEKLCPERDHALSRRPPLERMHASSHHPRRRTAWA